MKTSTNDENEWPSIKAPFNFSERLNAHFKAFFYQYSILRNYLKESEYLLGKKKSIKRSIVNLYREYK